MVTLYSSSIFHVYRHQYLPALVVGNGLVYCIFNRGRWNLGGTWSGFFYKGGWVDSKDYDLLVERPAKKVEVLQLEYGEVLLNETKKYEEPNSEHSSVEHCNYHHNKTNVVKTTLEMSHTEGKTWSHLVQFGILESSKLGVNFTVVNAHL